ncbi:MAG: hypothetical protein BWK80_19410 [Desulfobacteraceae bacterium IS3]|nr:MAG: hypothetical protein BWK80_19410 [Desulfobacteraceae bacterium IS3]
MSEIIYMADTNILYNWIAASNPALLAATRFIKPEIANQIKDFCEKNQNQIIIPDLVWVEFLSVILHKEIDISGNFEKTRQWFRNQETMIQQIESFVQNAANMDWLNWESDISPYPDAAELLRDTGLLDRDTFNWMKKNTSGSLTQKLLDGMDSVILIYLNELARRNSKDLVVLYTADYPLWRIFPRIRSYHRQWFQQNTAAVYALREDIQCRRCGHRNPAGILRGKQVLCHRCGKFLLDY